MNDRNCQFCGKEFTPTRANNFFCSKECHRKALRRRATISIQKRRAAAAAGIQLTKTCKICGKEFKPKCNQLYCSPECAAQGGKTTIEKYNLRVSRERINAKLTKVKQSKTCIICGAEFAPRSNKQLCCSKKCSVEHYHIYDRMRKFRRPRAERFCRYCGKKIEPGTRKKFFCSNECYAIYRLKSRRKVKETKVCIICGKEYQTSNCKSLTCSKNCYQRYTRKLNPPKRQSTFKASGTRICLQCNKEFVPQSPNQKICSDACRNERARIYHANYNQKPTARPVIQNTGETVSDFQLTATQREQMETLKQELLWRRVIRKIRERWGENV